MRRFFLISLFSLLTLSCTSTPMVALMGYDMINKRSRWQSYAENGDVQAQYELANSYCCHPLEGVEDKQKAIEWFCKAALNGHAKAQFELGRMYEKDIAGSGGINLKKDDARAYMWYSLAAQRLNEDARHHLENMKARLPDKKKAAGEMLLTEWKKVPCG